MIFKRVINATTQMVGKKGFKLKQHSPEIFIVAGGVGIVVSIVTACVATTKASKLIDESKKELADIQKSSEEHSEEEYTKDDQNKDKAIVYTKTALKVAKVYLPSAIILAGSFVLIFSSNNILKRRNLALTAAYKTIDSSYKKYRERIKDKFGDDVDRNAHLGIEEKEIEETSIDENGKEKKVKQKVQTLDHDQYSTYARVFDEYCLGWEKDAEQNLMFLKKQEFYANNVLKSRGYLYLNEVYESLGIPKTKAGQVVGWIYDENNPVGDNYVDFGIYDIHSERKRAFINGYERSIILDFNVDGDIAALMEEMEGRRRRHK